VQDDTAFDDMVKNAPYLQCGFNPETDGNKSLANGAFTSTNSTVRGTNWTVNAKSEITLALNGASSVLTTLFSVNNTQPAAAKIQADSYAAQTSTTMTFNNASNAETQAALDRKSTSPSCGILMTKSLKMVSKMGSTYVNVTFDKPAPYLINPMLTKSRIFYELKSPIVISGITATIDSNDAELMKKGRTRTGSVSISLINPNKTFTDSSGKSITINTDYAVRVVSKFDGAGTGALTWLNSVNEYFINTKTGNFDGIVVQIPRQELGIVVYSTQR
jgi:hypothetical protein